MVTATVVSAPRSSRVERKPKHKFQLRTRPFQIQPFMIAPVLPHESMKNAMLQARVVSDPIKNPLIGWWKEYHLFYVKHRDLDIRDDLVELMLQPDTNLDAHAAAAKAATYHKGGVIDWVQQCLDRVTRTYFRDEEDDTQHVIDGLPICQIEGNSWLDSVTDTTVLDDGATPTGTLEAQDMMQAQWEHMRALQMTDMSYEDWLSTFGVRKPKTELHHPELLRSIRLWQYPSNTIDPATGAPSSALSWSVAERADKDRYFPEPGFIFGVTLTRPKIYMGRQAGAGVSMMTNALNWLPAIMKDHPFTSLKEFANNAGPLATTTNGYWVDIRDLLLYGDQFVNFALTETNAGLVALPTAGLEKRYVSDADIDGLFKTPETSGFVREDGVISLMILGAQMDHT